MGTIQLAESRRHELRHRLLRVHTNLAVREGINGLDGIFLREPVPLQDSVDGIVEIRPVVFRNGLELFLMSCEDAVDFGVSDLPAVRRVIAPLQEACTLRHLLVGKTGKGLFPRERVSAADENIFRAVAERDVAFRVTSDDGLRLPVDFHLAVGCISANHLVQGVDVEHLVRTLALLDVPLEETEVFRIDNGAGLADERIELVGRNAELLHHILRALGRENLLQALMRYRELDGTERLDVLARAAFCSLLARQDDAVEARDVTKGGTLDGGFHLLDILKLVGAHENLRHVAVIMPDFRKERQAGLRKGDKTVLRMPQINRVDVVEDILELPPARIVASKHIAAQLAVSVLERIEQAIEVGVDGRDFRIGKLDLFHEGSGRPLALIAPAVHERLEKLPRAIGEREGVTLPILIIAARSV